MLDVDLKVDLLTEDIDTIALILTFIAESCHKGEAVKVLS